MKPLISLKHISYSIGSNLLFSKQNEFKEILKDISFILVEGKILGIAGESGSGKTTLAKIITGIIKPTAGVMNFNKSKEWEQLKTSPIQILFQNNGDILNPLRTVTSIIEEAIIIRNGNKENIDEIKMNIFNSLDLSENLLEKKGFELSGGEQQRAALARILAVRPELLILDEPFSAQDIESQLNFLNLFKKINKNYSLTMIVISHDLKIIRKLCDEIIIMHNGQIVEQGESQKIFENPSHPYTRFLLKAENYNLNYDELKIVKDFE